MKTNPPKAAFSFESFRFVSFQFNERADEGFEGLNILIDPSGHYNSTDKQFTLTLEFKASLITDEDKPPSSDNAVIQLKFQTLFTIEEEDGRIPDYFYPNSIGIAFPYIRSFLSTLTLQANNQLVMLPLMNLSHLAKPLQENTIFG